MIGIMLHYDDKKELKQAIADYIINDPCELVKKILRESKLDNPEIVWQPGNESKKSATILIGRTCLVKITQKSIKTEYQDIWNWSVNNVESFWSPMWDFLK